MSNVKGYAAFIAEQQRQLRVAGHINEALHVNLPGKHAESRYNGVIAHAKKMGYNVHHNEHFSDEKSGNKGTPDITVHYERGDHRGNADPVSIQVHKDGKANKDSTLASIIRGKFTKEEVELDEEVLVEFVRVAMQHAKDAISKGMSHDDAKNHVYKKTMAHAMTRPEQGAGGMITRIKIDRALDKAEAHLAKHYGSD